MVAAMLGIGIEEKPVIRDFSPNLERKYRVTVTKGEDDVASYRLKVRVVQAKAPKGEKGELGLDVRLTDYRFDVGGHRVSVRSMGGGPMAITPTGLPGGLNISGPQGPVWLPLLAFYLPATEGDFSLSKVEVGGGLLMSGKGTLKDRLQIEAALSRQDKELGKLSLAATLDAQRWPLKAEGTLVSADGTTQFKLERA